MYVKLGATIRGVFGTASFSTGAATNADSLPSAVVLDQGTPMGYAPVVVNQDTGLYEVQAVLSVGNGFTAGHEYSLYAVAVIGGLTARAAVSGISSFNLTARDPDDLAFPDTSGRALIVNVDGSADADLQKWIDVVPAPLSSSGYLQVLLQRWLTDNAGGTPDALQTNLVQAATQAINGTATAAISSTLLDTLLAGHMIAGSVGQALAATPTVPSIVTAILDELLSGHAIVGSVGDGIAIAAGLLQGNFFMDQTNNADPNGQTAARIRIFRNSADAAAATDGGSGQGEFASFTVTTTYVGPNKIATHRVVRA